MKLLCLGVLLVATLVASNPIEKNCHAKELQDQINALKEKVGSDYKHVMEEIKNNRAWEFKFDHRMLNWRQAEKACIEWGGHLLTVKSASEQKYFAGEVKARNMNSSWIGYTDEEVEGKWVWVGDEGSSYENWRMDELTHEPNGGRIQNCAHFWFGNHWDGRWDDWQCTRLSSFVCEKENRLVGRISKEDV